MKESKRLREVHIKAFVLSIQNRKNISKFSQSNKPTPKKKRGK